MNAVIQWQPPSYEDIVAATERLAPYLPITPLHSYPALNEAYGLDLRLKHENHHSIGCFKARGALNAILASDSGQQGVIASSSGNHGQGVAFAAKLVGVGAVVVLPVWAYEHKLRALQQLGAETILWGESASETNAKTRELASERGLLLVDDFQNPDVIAGAGTIASEMLRQEPSLETVVIPVGGGALAAGCGIALKALRPEVEVVMVQARECPGTFQSWQAGEPVRSPCSGSIADGLAVDMPEPEVLSVLVDVVDHGVLVDDSELRKSVYDLVSLTGNIAEPSAAASLAGCVQLRDRIEGGAVGVLITGSNISTSLLSEILSGVA